MERHVINVGRRPPIWRPSVVPEGAQESEDTFVASAWRIAMVRTLERPWRIRNGGALLVSSIFDKKTTIFASFIIFQVSTSVTAAFAETDLEKEPLVHLRGSLKKKDFHQWSITWKVWCNAEVRIDSMKKTKTKYFVFCKIFVKNYLWHLQGEKT